MSLENNPSYDVNKQQNQMVTSSLIASIFAAIGGFFIGGPAGAATAFMVTFASSYTLSMMGARQAVRGRQQEIRDRRDTIRSAVSPHRIIYGETRVSGNLVYLQVTGAEKEYLHMVIALAGHEVESIGDIFIDEAFAGEFNSGGMLTTGKYANHVFIRRYLGGEDQLADATLIAASGGRWTANHRLRGIAYIYVRLLWNQDLWTGIPNITANVRGRRCFDPRDGVTRYTDNPALQLRDYFRSEYGLNCDATEINDASVIAAANICDQWVNLPSDVVLTLNSVNVSTNTFVSSDTQQNLVMTGERCVFRVPEGRTAPGGITANNTYYLIRRTNTAYQLATTRENALRGTAIDITSAGTGAWELDTWAQPRYTSNGTFTRDEQPSEVEESIRETMNGFTVYSQGQWRMMAGAAASPTAAIGVSDLRGDVLVRPRLPRRDLVNQVRGTFVDPSRGFVSTDYPPYTDYDLVNDQDGGEVISRNQDMENVTSVWQAQRLAKAFLLRSRAVQLNLVCKISAMPVSTADVVSVTIPQLGYTAEPFRVLGWRLSGEDGGIGVDLDLAHDPASNYDWDATEAQNLEPNPELDVPTAQDVGPPANLVMSSGNSELIVTGDGTIISRIRVSWQPAAAVGITGYEIQWRRVGESDDFRNSARVERVSNNYYISPVVDGAVYEVRVRTQTSAGPTSIWLTNTHQVIGKTAAPAAPTNLVLVPQIGGFDIAWSASPDADYYQSWLYENTTNNFNTATVIAQISGNRLARAGLPALVTRHYWVRHVDTTGNESARFPAVDSISAQTLAPEAGLTVVANAAAITGTPGSLPPGGTASLAVFDNTTGRVWAWQTSLGQYTKSVDAADISGTLTDAQINSLAASKVTGQLSDSQLANIAAAKLTGQIVGTQITDNAITTEKLAAGAVTAGDIAAGAVTAGTIAANAVTAAEIAAGSITTAKIASGAVTANAIAAATITGDRIAANTITGSVIQGNTITADRLAVTSLSAITANMGNLTSGTITLDSTGNIRTTGATNYTTGTGVWMGSDGGVYKFRAGNPTGNRITWDGANLTITGTAVAGDIVVGANGSISGGATDYNTGTGFWMGNDGGTYRLHIGNPSGNYLRWTGTALEVFGPVTDTRPYAAGTNLLITGNNVNKVPLSTGNPGSLGAFPGNNVYQRYKSLRMARSGTVSVTFQLYTSSLTGGANYVNGRIYRNGVVVGTNRANTVKDTWQTTASENITVSAGDTIELWCGGPTTTDGFGYVRNLRVSTNLNLGEAVDFEARAWPDINVPV